MVILKRTVVSIPKEENSQNYTRKSLKTYKCASLHKFDNQPNNPVTPEIILTYALTHIKNSTKKLCTLSRHGQMNKQTNYKMYWYNKQSLLMSSCF